MRHYPLFSWLTVTLFIGCSSPNETDFKTAIELERESLNSGIRKDTLIHGYYFGMTREAVFELSKKIESEYKAEIQEDSSVGFIFAILTSKDDHFRVKAQNNFYYYNDKLFRVVTSLFINDTIQLVNKTNDTIQSIAKNSLLFKETLLNSLSKKQ